jgi:hypothetical protein
MRSSTLHDETDIVDVYRNKMKSNIRLKKKNLQLIFILFLVSLSGALILSGVTAFFLTEGPDFLFTSTLVTGIVRTQAVVSNIFGLSFVAQSQFLRTGGTSQATKANGTTSAGTLGVMSDAQFSSDISNYFNYTVSSISSFLHDAHSFHTPLPNSIDTLLYGSQFSWKVNSTVTIRGTFLNYLKEAFISYSLPNYRNFTAETPDFPGLNFPQLISTLGQLQKSLNTDLDRCLISVSSYLNHFLLSWSLHQLLFFVGDQRSRPLLFGPFAVGSQRHFRALFQNPPRNSPSFLRVFQ